VRTSRKGCRRGTLAAIGASLAVACAAPKPVYRTDSKPYQFTIDFDAADKTKCRVEVDFKNCDTSLKPNDPGQPKDCMRAQGGQDVVFVSSAGEFELMFDPFGKTSIASSGGKTPTLTLLRPTKAGPKRHSFWVKARACPAVDPEIIVEW
jgi:hypothetical protein